jgi:hypothetical protein
VQEIMAALTRRTILLVLAVAVVELLRTDRNTVDYQPTEETAGYGTVYGS